VHFCFFLNENIKKIILHELTSSCSSRYFTATLTRMAVSLMPLLKFAYNLKKKLLVRSSLVTLCTTIAVTHFLQDGPKTGLFVDVDKL